MPRVEVAGDICLKRPRPTQGVRANDDNDDNDIDDCGILCVISPARFQNPYLFAVCT